MFIVKVSSRYLKVTETKGSTSFSQVERAEATEFATEEEATRYAKKSMFMSTRPIEVGGEQDE